MELKKMTECNGCGVDTDIEGWFTYEKNGRKITIELCGFCTDKVKDVIEYSLS